MKNNRKKIKISICLLLVFGSIGLFSIPKTYSRFLDENTSTLAHKAQLYNLYNEASLVLDNRNSDINNAKFRFSFSEDKAVLGNEIDTYQIVIPTACTFDDIKIDNQSSSIDKTSHTHTITFNNRASRTVAVSMTCTVTSNTNLNFIANVNETITINSGTDKQKQEKFTYGKYSYLESYQNYSNRFHQPTDTPSSIQFGTALSMEGKFKTALQNNYPWIPEDILKQIFNRQDIMDSVITNALVDDGNGTFVSPKKTYTDYFIHQNDDRYLIIKIYSTGLNTRFTIKQIPIDEGITIAFNNTADNQLIISITGQNENNTLNSIQDLNAYFGKDITTNKQVKSNTENEYIVEYTIAK